jgi:transcriptional regulator with XRE-family HTH domain
VLDPVVQGERIAMLSKEAGLSQRDLERETGLSQSTINRIVKGTRPATLPELVQLSWALGVDFDDLVNEHPLAERVLSAPRASGRGVDAQQVRDRLVEYLRMDLHLDGRGVAKGCEWR